MAPEDLRLRTRRFAVEIVRFHGSLPRTAEARAIGLQLLRAGMGVGANYRAACRPKSDADFVAKLGTVIEECDETAFWLELLVEAGVCGPDAVRPLWKEIDELLRIFVTSRETARRNARARKARAKKTPAAT